MKSSKTSFLRNCISGWNVRNTGYRQKFCSIKSLLYFCIVNETPK